MGTKAKVYWDACVWISLITKREGRVENCLEVIRRAKADEVEIWTSSLNLAEVFKSSSNGDVLELPVDADDAFAEYVDQPFVMEVMVDHDIGTRARQLLRTFPALRKPMDALHLATAVANNCDEFHTYDQKNLLALKGQILRDDGHELTICEPPPPVQPALDLQLPTAAGTDANKADDVLPVAAAAVAATETGS